MLHSAIALEYSELIDPFSINNNPCESVRNGQFICKDCATLAFCSQQDGNWITVELTSCDTNHNMYCEEETRGCVFQQSCKLPNRGPKFECQNAGIFPDPYDCKYYHVCNNNNVGERLVCPRGTAYSPATKTCSLPTNSDICLEPQYKCNRLGDMGAWPTDPTIFYVCHITSTGSEQIRYPILYSCSPGYVFINNKCTLFTTPTLAPPPAPTAVPEIQTCKPGSGLSPNPYDCYSYLICVDGQLIPANCPASTYYNDKKKSCDIGKC